MTKRTYIQPMIEWHDTEACLPLAGSFKHPGGEIDDFTWDDGERTGGDGDNPGGSIDDFEWED